MFYVYDGSWDGMMCLIHATARDGVAPEGIFRARGEGRPMFESVFVETGPLLAEATSEVLKRRLPMRALHDAWYALLSEGRAIDLAAWHFLERLWREKRGAAWDLSDPHVVAVLDASRRTRRECAHWMGLIRFRKVGGAYYAPFEPACDILPLLARHFSRRLSEDWVLHDVKRDRAALHRGGRWIVADVAFHDLAAETREELFYQDLWREFFRSVSIEERRSAKRQKKFLPSRVRAHLIERPGEDVRRTSNEGENCWEIVT